MPQVFHPLFAWANGEKNVPTSVSSLQKEQGIDLNHFRSAMLAKMD
jgi:hypothetical protein